MKNLFTFFLLLFVSQISNSQVTTKDIIGKLKIETTDNTSIIVATASNTTEVYFSFKYVFSVIYTDGTDKPPKDSQEDLFALDPSETKELYKTSISVEKNQRVIVLLLIYDEDDTLIAKDRVVINEEDPEEVTEEKKKEDGITLIGLVADETKTKFGKDFYDFFYFYYNYYKFDGEKIVKVKEIVSFRRNTQIQVVIDEEVIFEFFSRPDTEFLEAMSKQALRKVYSYFRKLEKEKSYITRY